MAKEAVRKDMTIGDVVAKHPEAAMVMMKSGMHCIGCHVAAMETIEQGAMAHGMGEKQIDEMMKEINRAVSKKKE